MNAQMLPRSKRTPKSWLTQVLGINPSSPFFAAGMLVVLILLSGCASQPARPACEYPRPNPDLMAELPPPGWFRETLECILKKGQLQPGETLDPTCERLVTELTE